MSDIITALSNHFELASTRAVKERGCFLCETRAGTVKISKTFERHQAIHLRHRLLEYLEEAGFPWTDKIALSTHGIPFVQLGRETYVMSQHIAGHDMNLDCPQDVVLALESLAHFHIVARGFGSSVNQGIDVAPSMTEIFDKNHAFLTRTAKQMGKISRLSDFDIMFIKSAPQYIGYAQKSAQLLAQTDYTALYATALAQQHICHNALKEENLSISGDRCYITNFSNAAIDAQITDLASFLRRYARRSKCEISLDRLVEIYDRICPLPSSAMEIINAILVHPWQFVKIVRQYHNKKRGWTPVAIMSRMHSLLEEQENYDAYIRA